MAGQQKSAGVLTLTKYDSMSTSAVCLSGRMLGTFVFSGKSMMLSRIRCLFGSLINGEPISVPAVFSTMMRISCRIERVEESPM